MAKKIFPRDVNMAKKMIVITNKVLEKEEQEKNKIEESEKKIPFILDKILATAGIGYDHCDIYITENTDRNYIKTRLYYDYGFSFDDVSNIGPIRVCWVSPQKKLDIGVLAGYKA